MRELVSRLKRFLNSQLSSESSPPLERSRWQSTRGAETPCRLDRSVAESPSEDSEVGFAYLTAGRFDAAETALRQAVTNAPDTWRFHFGLGLSLRAQKRQREAIIAFQRALALGADEFECLICLAGSALELGQPGAAEAYARRAVAIDPNRPTAWNHLGVSLDRQDRFEDAAEIFRRVENLELTSNEVVDGFANLAINSHEAGRIDEAIAVCRRNLPLRPAILGHFHYSLCLLTKGQFAEGWEQYEFRLFREAALLRRPSVQMPTWSGQNLQGRTVLLRVEQGAGDTIQFLRYAPLLKALGARVIAHLPRGTGFGKLAKRFAGVDSVIEEGLVEPYDFQAHLLSLARMFETNLDSIPSDVPYVTPDADDVERWSGRLASNGKLRVGLVWAGSMGHPKDRYRSIRLTLLSSLIVLDGVRFFSLQKGAAVTELKELSGKCDVVDLGSQLEDYADTAAVVSQLDLVISVDTSVAHLAGALAKPVWLLTATPSDWRWLTQREDSPWYPTMRLFRQSKRGEWSDVVERVTQALRERNVETADLPSRVSRSKRQNATTRTAERTVVRATPSALAAATETKVGLVQYFPSIDPIGPSIELYGEYLQPQIDLLARMIGAGDVIVEVSADVGIHTLALSKAVTNSGKVIAYESRSPINRVLRQNLAANKIENVMVVDRTPSYRLATDSQNDSKAPIASQSIDGMRLSRLHLIRINESVDAVEVLLGATDTLWRLRPTLFVRAADDADLANLARHVAGVSYRCWSYEVPLFNPVNFNQRTINIFNDRTALALVALPEEAGDELDVAGCAEIPRWRIATPGRKDC